MGGQRAYEGPLPPVQGRHRNHALAVARRMTAARMVVSGCTYQEVADRLGYQNRGTVHRLVQPVLAQIRPTGFDEAFQLHYERLESLFQPHYARALAGDSTATRMALQVLRETTKLLQFFPPGPEGEKNAPPWPVIDPADLVQWGRARDSGYQGGPAEWAREREADRAQQEC
ncbi:hypothetical protein ACI3ET_01130 [Ornithinimicrobium sp. LYQ121]|uniref:hypothetical protein n=1 Tax=Ornithinimicrobium sp. LYQ121 TaxID=3378801 RepID=UPI00385260D8